MLTDATVSFFLNRMLMEYVPSSDFGMGEIAYWTMANGNKSSKEQAKNDICNLFFKEQKRKSEKKLKNVSPIIQWY